MPKRKTAKPSSVKRTRQSKGKGRAKLPAEPSTVEQPFLSSIANVRLAVKLLREAALSPIPNLGEIAPDQFDGYGEWGPFPTYPGKTGDDKADAEALADIDRQYVAYAKRVNAWDRKHGWSEKARSRARDAFAWRDKLTTRIGRTDVENRHRPDPEWDHERLSRELGYLVTKTNSMEPSETWGPPESVLGEFYEDDYFGTGGQYDLSAPMKFLDTVRLLVHAGLVRPDQIRVRSEHLESQPFNALSPHFSGNDNARAILGPPPPHLAGLPSYQRIDRRIVNGTRLLADHEFIHPAKWWQYADVILEQCLIERTRALELCRWCDERIEAWESAYYPTITIGPEIVEPHSTTGKPKSTGRRHLRVTIAGTPAPDTPDTIISSLARDLLLIRDGMGSPVELPNADAQVDKLRNIIPLLRPHLIHDGDRCYRLPLGMVTPIGLKTERIKEAKSWPPQMQE